MISLCLSSRGGGGGGGGGGQLFRGRQTLVSVFGDGSVTFVEKQPVFSLVCFQAILIVLLCSTGQMKADVALLVLDLQGGRSPANSRPARRSSPTGTSQGKKNKKRKVNYLFFHSQAFFYEQKPTPTWLNSVPSSPS